MRSQTRLSREYSDKFLLGNERLGEFIGATRIEVQTLILWASAMGTSLSGSNLPPGRLAVCQQTP